MFLLVVHQLGFENHHCDIVYPDYMELIDLILVLPGVMVLLGVCVVAQVGEVHFLCCKVDMLAASLDGSQKKTFVQAHVST